MRLTIDTTTIKFAAAGVAEPVLDFATKSQKTDEHSVPLFQVPVFSAGGGIKDAFTVKVAGEVKGLGCTYELRGREGGESIRSRGLSTRASFLHHAATCGCRCWSGRHASRAN